MRGLKISVVVSTYNRAEILRMTLQHLADQDLDPESYDVIVVDDGSIDRTREVVEQMIQRTSLRGKYLHHANRGPGYTQNRGIREAQGSNVLLMADDVFLTPSALSAHLDCHAKHPEEEVAVLGRVLQSPLLNQSVFLRTWKAYRLDNLADQQQLPYYMFWACNISFKRDFMLRYGMFREEMGRAGAAGHEDVELGYRLHNHSLRIIHCREALGYHYHVATLQQTIMRSYERGLNWPDFQKLVPEPEIAIRYRVYNLRTLAANFISLVGPRRKYIVGTDRSFILLSLRYLLRSVIFNRLTTPYFWLPILNYADRNRILAKCMVDNFYRGVVLYHFLKGCQDSQKVSDFPDPNTRDGER
jgi:glycosyltransferase involved in cell wall biosynthesis